MWNLGSGGKPVARLAHDCHDRGAEEAQETARVHADDAHKQLEHSR